MSEKNIQVIPRIDGDMEEPNEPDTAVSPVVTDPEQQTGADILKNPIEKKRMTGFQKGILLLTTFLTPPLLIQNLGMGNLEFLGLRPSQAQKDKSKKDAVDTMEATRKALDIARDAWEAGMNPIKLNIHKIPPVVPVDENAGEDAPESRIPPVVPVDEVPESRVPSTDEIERISAEVDEVCGPGLVEGELTIGDRIRRYLYKKFIKGKEPKPVAQQPAEKAVPTRPVAVQGEQKGQSAPAKKGMER